MLAAAVKDINKLSYPLILSPKLDGIRCLTMPWPNSSCLSVAVTRNLKRIPNDHIYMMLSKHCPPGLDGELILKTSQLNKGQPGFCDTSSAVMRHDLEPDFEFHVFDYFGEEACASESRHNCIMVKYELRLQRLKELWGSLPYFCKPVPTKLVKRSKELIQFEEDCLDAGYEGICARVPHGPYKFGRSTPREQWLLKVKRFLDAEAEILDFEELMSNQNEHMDGNLVAKRRHTYSSGMVPAGRLGALVVRDLKTGITFNVGSGFGTIQRQEIWDNRDFFRGKIIKYKYQPTGVKLKPRSPIFLGFRFEDDM